MEKSKRYLIVTSFGWGFVGVFERNIGISEIELSDGHFITRCGEDTDWGRFVRNGPGRNAIVNKVGTITINLDHRIWSVEYPHELPKSR